MILSLWILQLGGEHWWGWAALPSHASPAHRVAAMVWPTQFEQWNGILSAVLVVLLVYQQWRLYQLRQRSAKREELFRIVAENAADMIALVDVKGRRLYNSPAYEKVLGYSAEELAKTSPFEQIHPEDRFNVLNASREARSTGVGQKLEYRIRHKNGTWRVLESTASTIKNEEGEVEKLVIVNRDITDRKAAEEALAHNSFHDGLTGLPNRNLFLDRLQHSFSRAQRSPDSRYAVLFVDVDGFKIFNDTMGTKTGDLVIKEIGRRLAACLRSEDTVARPKGKLPIRDILSRMGGDEFTILLEDIRDASDAMRVAKRIQEAVSRPLLAEGNEVHATVSIGIALSTTDHERAEDYLQDADIAMRRAKAAGGSRCEVFDEGMHRRALKRLTLEAELQTALDSGQFQLHYQPILNLETRQIVGFEALLRWNHPEKGVISPHQFIEVAENVGLIVSIGKWTLREACRQLQAWISAYPLLSHLTMTVNVSVRQLAHPQFVADTESMIKEFRLGPSRLQLEVAEEVTMADPKLTFEVLTQLKRLGVCISIGDFGKGLSSLSCLRRLPIDELKIDRSLINGISSDIVNRDIVRLMITLTRTLKVKLVAEGVETVTHLELLRNLGCEFGQGYLFSPPVEQKQAEQLLRQPSTATNAGTAALGK
jgi:diguanylate cyclase (GGDEF)-like protein/PAS domain S-box-containing protein